MEHGGRDETYPSEDERTPPYERAARMCIEERPEDGRADEHGDPDDGESEAHAGAVRFVSFDGVHECQ